MPDLSRIGEFVGRSAELATVERAVDGARDGAPSILLVGGDADPWHRCLLDRGIADVEIIVGGATRAAVAAERGWDANVPPARLWSARFAMVSVSAAVEGTLDALARRQSIDVEATVARLQGRIDSVRAQRQRQRQRRRRRRRRSARLDRRRSPPGARHRHVDAPDQP